MTQPLVKRAGAWDGLAALAKLLGKGSKKFLLSPYGSAAVNATAWDAMLYSPDKIPFTGDWDPYRFWMLGLNGAVGAGAHHFGKSHALKNALPGAPLSEYAHLNPVFLATLTTTPVKDLLVGANNVVWRNSFFNPAKAEGIVKVITQNPPAASEVDSAHPAEKPSDPASPIVAQVENKSGDLAKWLLGGGLGLAALASGGIWLHDYLAGKREREKKDQEEKSRKAIARIRIPGADGDLDNATEIEVPVDAPDISKVLNSRIGTAAKRTLGREAKYSGYKKDPITGKRIPYADYVALYGTEAEKKERADAIKASMPKVASAVAWQPQPQPQPQPQAQAQAQQPRQAPVTPLQKQIVPVRPINTQTTASALPGGPPEQGNMIGATNKKPLSVAHATVQALRARLLNKA